MSRAQKNVRRGKGSGAGVQRQPMQLGEGKGNGVTKRTGLERPQVATRHPVDIADPQARVIRTRS